MRSTTHKAAVVLLLSALAAPAPADERTAYNERVAARLLALFQALDRDTDGVLTREETRGDLDLGPRFPDMDVNSDGRVTREELQRYLEQRFGAQPQSAAAGSPVPGR